MFMHLALPVRWGGGCSGLSAGHSCRAAGLPLAPREAGVLSGLGSLQPYLLATAQDLATALQQRAIADFNNWLVGCRASACVPARQPVELPQPATIRALQVKVRAEARTIGYRAVRRAAAERAQEALLSAERQAVMAVLADKRPNLAAAAECIALQTSAAATPSATRVAARDVNIELLEGIDMAPMHR